MSILHVASKLQVVKFEVFDLREKLKAAEHNAGDKDEKDKMLSELRHLRQVCKSLTKQNVELRGQASDLANKLEGRTLDLQPAQKQTHFPEGQTFVSISSVDVIMNRNAVASELQELMWVQILRPKSAVRSNAGSS